MIGPIPTTSLILGRLDASAILFHEPIMLSTFAIIAFIGAVLLWAITCFGRGRLWRDWFTSIEREKIGIMYMAPGLVMPLRGLVDAVMRRLQQAIGVGGAEGCLPPHLSGPRALVLHRCKARARGS